MAAMAAAAAIASATTTVLAKRQERTAALKKGRFDRTVAHNQAASERAAADAEVEALRNRNRRLLGQQRVNVAKNGVQLNGSAALVIFDSSVQAELDALNALHRGRVKAQGSQTRGDMAWRAGKNIASAATDAATAAIIKGVIGVGGAAAGGASAASTPTTTPAGASTSFSPTGASGFAGPSGGGTGAFIVR